MKIFLFFLFGFSICLTSYANIINVPSDYATIQSALDNCSDNDTILVQPGTYFENIIWPNISGIKLFAAGDSTNTVIDGNHLGRVLTFSEENIDTTTIVRGFKITNGYLEGDDVVGAGIYIYQCGVKLEEICISGNHLFSWSYAACAGLYSEGTNLVFRNSAVQYNYIDSAEFASGAGLGVSGDYIYIDNIQILYNRVEFNGNAAAAFIGGSQNVNVKNCKVMHNSAGTSSTWCYGAIEFNACVATISNLIVDSNETGSGASWYYGSGVYFEYADITAIDLTVSNNITGDSGGWYFGGGIYIEESDVNLTNLTVAGNKTGDEGSYYYGAGVYVVEANVVITNALIVDNEMGLGGNWYEGGGIKMGYGFIDPPHLQLTNVTVANNRRTDNGKIDGSGIYMESGVIVDCFNSIFWNPNIGSEIKVESNVSADFDYCDIRKGFAGVGNIDADPLFVSGTDFHLLPNSPCLGIGQVAGSPSFDIEGSPRPLPAGTNPDLGCYEMDIALAEDFDMVAHQVSIFPNPATDHITIPIEPGEMATVEIRDAFGRPVSQSILNSTERTLSVGDLRSGFYMITIQSNEERVAGKFMKM